MTPARQRGQWLTVGLRDTILTLVVPRSRSDAAGGTVTADVYSGSFLGRRLVGQLANLRLESQRTACSSRCGMLRENTARRCACPPERIAGMCGVSKAKLLLVNDYTNFDAAAGPFHVHCGPGNGHGRSVHPGGSASTSVLV
ncbi:MAG: hypothetical protein MZV64_31505 [Ignavibacteriales bacterium]|nr:hypothetical protein [Ignavibacteriales bacterium]